VGAREREQAVYGFEDTCDIVVHPHEEGLKKPGQRSCELVYETRWLGHTRQSSTTTPRHL
jgi:hypothetical protein